MEKQQIPMGYKQTEVGVIPVDWEVIQLQKVCRTPITYGIVQCGPHINNGVPYIRVSDMNSNELDVAEMLRTSSEIASSFARSKVDEGDIVYALRGKLGEVKWVGPSVAGANLTQGTARISPSKGISNKYLFWTLRSPQSLKQALQEAKGSTFVEITLANLKGIEVPVPKLMEEQTAIANALSDVDALITALEKLIDKKNAIKTATMQQLLTGKKRLPPFDQLEAGYKQTELGEIPRDWEISAIVDISQIMTGTTPPTTDISYYGNEYLFVSPADLNYGKYIKKSIKGLSKKGFSICRKYPPNSILFTCIGSTIGKCGIAGVELTSNQQINAVLPSASTEAEYIYYQLLYTAPKVKQQAGEQAVPLVNKTQFGEHKISIPSKKEQTAIANVLSDMDTELDALQQRLAKTQHIKQGMMQELLTGKTRLVTI